MNGRVTISQIAAELGIARPYLNKMIELGIERGWITDYGRFHGALHVDFDQALDYLVMHGNKKARAYKADKEEQARQQQSHDQQWQDHFNEWFHQAFSGAEELGGHPHYAVAAFKVLGIEPTFDFKAIKSAYYAAAKLHHPDHGGSTAMMQSINEAFETLKQRYG